MDEDELIGKLNQGDESAFKAVFEKHFAKLCLYAEHFLRDKQMAREIVEDLFCDLWGNCKNITIESNLSGYLYRSIHNRCLKYLRHEKVKQKHIEYLFTDREILEHASSDFTEALLISNELEKDIKNAIESLPGQCKEIFLLNRYDNFTYQEIAEKLGISVNTVKTQMTRALQKLRSRLKEYLVRH